MLSLVYWIQIEINNNIIKYNKINYSYKISGVKIQLSKDGKGFELHVHATKYNYSTGQLDKAQKWFGPGDHPINDFDYQRER